MNKKIVEILRKIVLKYDIDNGLLTDKPLYMCPKREPSEREGGYKSGFEVRNRYKNDKYKIPDDMPQCPIYKDNRCCGGCKLAVSCDHAVNCNCYGYAYATLGGDDSHYLRKCTDYSGIGARLDADGKFDWDFYYLRAFLGSSKKNKFFITEIDDKKYIAEIKKINKKTGSFKCFIRERNYYRNIKFKRHESYHSLHPTYESLEHRL